MIKIAFIDMLVLLCCEFLLTKLEALLFRDGFQFDRAILGH